MKKRILSIVLAALMLLSIMPITAMAVDEPVKPVTSVSADSGDGSVHIVKSVDEDGTALTLEAYATNTVTTVTTQEPLDIVLVLDVSSSMINNRMGGYDAPTRLAALQTAVNNFIGSVAEQTDMDGNAIDHKISIVTFSSSAQTVMELTSTTSEASVKRLQAAVNGLTTSTETRSNLGMQEAKAVLDNRSDKNRKSVVVLFTDGTPTASGSFDEAIASNAIAEAKNMKDAGTTVFTVGIFEGADPSKGVNDSGTSSENKYMHAMSSNYPAATYTYSGGYRGSYSFDFGDRAAGDYYLAALNANELNNVFQTISEEVGSLTAKVDDKSVLSDTLSGAFTFNVPEGNTPAQAITVKKQQFLGLNEDGSRKWGEPENVSATISVDTKTKELTVNGFDYGANAVTTKTEGGQTTYSGYKLVVTILIKPDTNYSDWKQGEYCYDTNSTAEGSKAGLSYGEKGSKKLELTDSPEAPVTGYKVEYKFDGDHPNVSEPTDPKGYITGQKVTAEPLNPGTVSGEDGTWTFNGWKPEGEQTFEDADITFSGTWTFKEADKPGLSVTKTAKVNGTELAENEKAKVGDTITYTITVTNTGNVELSGVTIEDTFGGKGTLKDADGNGVTLTDGKFTITVGTLGTAETDKTKTYTYTYVVVAEDADTTIANNVVAKSGDTKNDGGTETPVAKQYSVTYEYPDVKPEGETAPVDSKKYSVGEAYELETVTAPEGWTFDGWYKHFDSTTKEFTDEVTSSAENKMVEGGVTLYGKWTAPAEKFTVSYDYVDKNGNVITDTEVLATKPTDNREFSDGESVTPLAPTETEVTVTGGKWTFVKWDESSKTVNGENVTFTGTWEFKADELPPETYRTIDLTIDKTLINHRGVAPGETYEFQVFYKGKNGEAVNIGDRLTLTLAEGDTWDRDKFQIKLPQSVLTDTDNEHFWPEETVKGFDDDDNVIEVKVRYAYVYEIDGSTKGMDYDDAVPFGRLIPNAIANSAHAWNYGDYTLVSYQTEDDIFYFTNEYTKPTDDKEVKPAKVGPQLNRDDHVAYIMGYPDGNVRPEGEITRAEACTIFFRLLTESSRDYYFARTNDYSDVNAGDWFNNAISTLSNAGIVTGYNDGSFRPNQPITRGEMAKIIANFANLNKGTKSFTDLAGHWSKSYVELAAGNGWIAGYPDGSFRPDQKITRAETVTMINRVLERVPAKESRLLSRSIMLTFPDNNPGDWYYIAIQEASNSHEYQRSVYETTGDEMWTKLIENVDWTKLEK